MFVFVSGALFGRYDCRFGLGLYLLKLPSYKQKTAASNVGTRHINVNLLMLMAIEWPIFNIFGWDLHYDICTDDFSPICEIQVNIS